jgi:putative phosphoribosyl transferase
MPHREVTQGHEQPVRVPCGPHLLEGILVVPAEPVGVVLFAHGSGSGRLSPRNQFVAACLQRDGLATLLVDLLEEDEAEDRAKVFDIALLAGRLASAANWLARQPGTASLPLGLFGASTGAAAALVATARRPDAVGAVVSRGGRPDLAWDDLPDVRAPTLLIVGGRDVGVIELNEEALARLRCPKELTIIHGATHLFPERGALEEVARLAGAWFTRHLTAAVTRGLAPPAR